MEISKASATAAGLCFAASATHVGNVLKELKKDPRWTLFDLRNIGEKEILSALMRVPQPATMVLATEQTNPLPAALHVLFKAVQDRRRELVLERRKVVLHRNTRFHLLTWGTQSWNENEAELLLDFWDAVDEFGD